MTAAKPPQLYLLKMSLVLQAVETGHPTSGAEFRVRKPIFVAQYASHIAVPTKNSISRYPGVSARAGARVRGLPASHPRGMGDAAPPAHD